MHPTILLQLIINDNFQYNNNNNNNKVKYNTSKSTTTTTLIFHGARVMRYVQRHVFLPIFTFATASLLNSTLLDIINRIASSSRYSSTSSVVGSI